MWLVHNKVKDNCLILRRIVKELGILLLLRGDPFVTRQGGSKRVYPAETFGAAPKRTHEDTVAEMQRIKESGGVIGTLETFGIKGPTILLSYTSYPGFDLIKNVPTDYMHLYALGTSKRALENLLRDKESSSGHFRSLEYSYIKGN